MRGDTTIKSDLDDVDRRQILSQAYYVLKTLSDGRNNRKERIVIMIMIGSEYGMFLIFCIIKLIYAMTV